MQSIVLNWSSGKDAALAFHYLQQEKQYRPDRLLTTLSAAYERVSMHGTREAVLDLQAESMGISLQKIRLPENAGMDIYNSLMAAAVSEIRASGTTMMAFGDIFLEDLREFREAQLAKVNMEAVFPLWKKDTRTLVQEVEDAGIEAMIVCVNDRYLDKSFLGRYINRDLLDQIPHDVDPCGEHGEFHTLVVNAPYFKEPLPVSTGEIVYKQYEAQEGTWDNGFYYLDVVPKV